MKLAELEPGKTYWFATSNNRWHESDRRSYDAYPVRVETLDRYVYRPPRFSTPPNWTPDKSARKEPKGRHIRVTIPGDPEAQYPSGREDRVAYVEPRYLRMEVEAHRELVARNRAAQKEAAEKAAQRRQAGHDQRDQLRDRAVSLGLSVGVEIGYADRPIVKIGPDDFAALMDRLEAAERAVDRANRRAADRAQ